MQLRYKTKRFYGWAHKDHGSNREIVCKSLNFSFNLSNQEFRLALFKTICNNCSQRILRNIS